MLFMLIRRTKMKTTINVIHNLSRTNRSTILLRMKWSNTSLELPFQWLFNAPFRDWTCLSTRYSREAWMMSINSPVLVLQWLLAAFYVSLSLREWMVHWRHLCHRHLDTASYSFVAFISTGDALSWRQSSFHLLLFCHMRNQFCYSWAKTKQFQSTPANSFSSRYPPCTFKWCLIWQRDSSTVWPSLGCLWLPR